MRRFQVIFSGGLVQNIEADNYRVVRQKVVFRTDGRPSSVFRRASVIMIDEVAGLSGGSPAWRPAGMTQARHA